MARRWKNGDKAKLKLRDSYDPSTDAAVERSATGTLRSFEQDGDTRWELVVETADGMDGMVGTDEGAIRQYPAIGIADIETADLTDPKG